MIRFVPFTHHDQCLPDRGKGLPPACTWDRPRVVMGPPILGPDLAVVTCDRGHTTRISARVHRVDAVGRVWPSYVCTAAGCSFHAFVWLLGWTS